jgi:DNA-binding IclR family transcriptional regulator
MPKTSSKPKSEYAIQTVTNALRMLEVFHSETELGVSDLARRLGLHKNNAFRLLATLELAGYIQQTPSTELYHLGPRCLELGQAFARSHSLMDRARPILRSLAAENGETSHLGVLSGHEVVHLDGALPDQLVLSGLRVGTRLGAHCTALGKVLLAGELGHRGAGATTASGTEAWLQALLSGRSLRQHTPATLADPEKLVEELRAVELRGYATDVEEYAPGLRCVAAPVRDGSNRVVAAISLSGPATRLDEEALHGPIAAAVTRAADRLSAAIGGA